jgi:anti-sigma-K factor RskA
MNYLLPRRLDLLAREYALGTLAGPARRRFEAVLRKTPAARLAVGVWQERLASLASDAPAMQPSDAVWQGLERRLFATGPARPADAPADARPSWLSRWLSGRAFGGVLAGALLAVLVLRMQPGLIDSEPLRDALPPSYVGLLTDPQNRPTLLASSKRHGRQLSVKLLQPLVVPEGSVAQLWALPKDGTAPFPLGVVPARGGATIALPQPAEKLFFGVARLGVSVESGAARPGATPSGEFVASGHCVKLW